MPPGITLLKEKENAMTPSQKVTTRFQIDGMTCGHCAGTIEKALRASLPEVEPVLEVAEKRLVATFDPGKIAVSQIVSVVGEAGYEAKPL
jgi:copper chaperone CopZ